MKPLTLTRKVKLDKYELLMEIGRQENRPELNAILMLAQEQGGKITATDVCNELLLGRPAQVGRAILDRCRYYDLIDKNDRITDIGREALSIGEVFFPERGRFLLWYTDDRLLNSAILHLEALPESTLFDEVYPKRHGNNNNQNDEDTEEIPEKIKALEGKIFSLHGKGRGRIQIRKINSQGLKRELDTQDSLSAQLKLSPNQITRVSIDGRFNFEEFKPEIIYENYWLSVLGPYADSWETTRNKPALKISYNKLEEQDIFTFKKNLNIQSPTLPTYGAFEDATIQDVPIKPATLTDAEKWGKHLLKNSINTYTDQEMYQNLQNSIRMKFIDYPNIQLPSIEELLEEIKESKTSYERLPREYWYLQAPIDLVERRT